MILASANCFPSEWKPTNEMIALANKAIYEDGWYDTRTDNADIKAALIAVQPLIVAPVEKEIKRLREALRQITQFKPQLNKDRDFGQETNFATAIIIAEVALAQPQPEAGAPI